MITFKIILEYPRTWKENKKQKQKCSLAGDNEKIQSAVLINAFRGCSSQRERTQKATHKNIDFFKECTHKRNYYLKAFYKHVV